MADVEEFVRNTQEGLKYLLGKRKKKVDEMGEAVEGPVSPPETPPAPAPPIVEPEKELRRRSTGGSQPFSEEELARGYRKL